MDTLLARLAPRATTLCVRSLEGVGGGRGLFASRAVQRGGRLAVELPLGSGRKVAAAQSRGLCPLCRCPPRKGCEGCAKERRPLIDALAAHAALEQGPSVFGRLAEQVVLRVVVEETVFEHADTLQVLGQLLEPEMSDALAEKEWGPLCEAAQQRIGAAAKAAGVPVERSSVFPSQFKALFFMTMGKLHLNALGAEDATALYPLLVFANHACRPNLGVRFEGARVELVALRDVAKGEELRINYAETLGAKSAKQLGEFLKFNYGFECSASSPDKCGFCGRV